MEFCSENLSNQLNAQHIRLSTKVTNVEDNHVYVSSSEKITFRHLVVATDKDCWNLKGRDKNMREIQQEGYRP